MRIGGLQKCSLIDYPEKLSCVIFTQGCNFRCPWCHNRELVLPEHFSETIPEREVMDFLDKRRSYLDGVVITGGEPTSQGDLLEFLSKIQSMGYLIKLDTNGSRPEVLKRIFQKGLANYIAMDIKTSFEKYKKAIGVDYPVEKIQESIELIQSSGIKHEFRTTVVRPFCEFEDVCKISSVLGENEAYRLQEFRKRDKMINDNFHEVRQIASEELEFWREKIHASA